MKVADNIPIYKNGDPQNPNNYQPISLLRIFNKLLEKVMYSRLYKHLKLNNVLHSYQFLFRTNHSTILALIETLDNVCEKLDTGVNVCGIYLDLQRAFNSMSHGILLDKLYRYGV